MLRRTRQPLSIRLVLTAAVSLGCLAAQGAGAIKHRFLVMDEYSNEKVCKCVRHFDAPVSNHPPPEGSFYYVRLGTQGSSFPLRPSGCVGRVGSPWATFRSPACGGLCGFVLRHTPLIRRQSRTNLVGAGLATGFRRVALPYRFA